MDRFAGFEEVATEEQFGLAHLVAAGHDELGGRLGMLLPKGFDGFVLRFPLGDRLAESGEGHRGLDGRIGGGGDGEAHPTEVVVLIVVAVPAAVILLQVDGDNGALRVAERLFGDEDGLAGLVASAGSGVDAPSGFVVAVEGVGNRAEEPLGVIRLVPVDGFKRGRGHFVVG